MKALVYWMVALMVGLGACTSDVDKDKDDDDDEIAEWDELMVTLQVNRPTTTKFNFTSKASDEYDPLNGRYPSSKVDFPTELEINWGDGQTTKSNTHDYQDAGTYLVKIKGKGIGTFDIESGHIRFVQFYVKSWPNLIYLTQSPTSIDFTKCPKLENIFGYYDSDISLDFSKCPKLKHLILKKGYSEDLPIISDLNLTGCTELKVLDCQDCELTKLDVSTCTKLEILDCNTNQITQLDVSKNLKLAILYFYNNQLTNLDLSRNTELTSLGIDDNQLTNLDVSKNTKLTHLYVEHNQLTNLDLSKNTELTNLHLGESQLTNVDLSRNTKLELFYCRVSQLTNLDLSKHTELIRLDVGWNQLTNLNLSKDTKLVWLSCENNQLNHSALNQIYNALPYTGDGIINVSNNPATGDTYIATQKGWDVWNYTY